MHFNIARQPNPFLLFFNPIPVHHPDVLFAMHHHMVYHADPQLIVKRCNRGIHFFQRIDKVTHFNYSYLRNAFCTGLLNELHNKKESINFRLLQHPQVLLLHYIEQDHLQPHY